MKMKKFLRKYWYWIVVIIALIIFFYPKYCGNWGTTAPNMGYTYHDCTCVGIKMSVHPGIVGGDNVNCWGIIVSRSCYENRKTEEQGYFRYYKPCESTTTTIPTIPSFTDHDLEQGWYYGSIDQRKPGTPEHWLHKGEGSRSARWFDPVTENEDYCTAILRESESIEETISKICDNDDGCESRQYIGSLTNAVKCFSKEDPTIADYDYAFELYRELDCPLSMGGAPYSNVYCECTDGICTAILET